MNDFADNQKQELQAKQNRIIVLYFGETIDYKYRQIMKHLPSVDYRPGKLKSIVKELLKKPFRSRDMVVHVRYIFWRGHLQSLFIYTLIVTLCKLKNCRLVWSCHNLYEHSIPSRRFSAFLRKFMARFSDAIIVFHQAMTPYLHPFVGKVTVANFGEFKSHIRDPAHPKNPDFMSRYQAWLDQRQIESPDVIFIGDYKPAKNIEFLVELAHRRSDWNIVLIAPKMTRPENLPKNVFLYRECRVFGELDHVLKSRQVIGFIGHDNLSVPSGFHLYSAYSVPMVGIDVEPVRSLLEEWGCGTTFVDLSGLEKAVNQIRADYSRFMQNAKKAGLKLTWERSAAAHKKAFCPE